jgi:hypothetical protein
VDLATNNFQVTISPQTTVPTALVYSVGDVTTTNIVIIWANATAANQATGALTFNWVAVR